MATPLQLAAGHRRHRVALKKRTIRAARTLWRNLDRNDLDGSWRTTGPQMYALLSNAQRDAASEADPFLHGILDAQDIDPDPAGDVVPDALSGIASDGRDLASLLYEPVITTKTAIGRGTTLNRAAALGEYQLMRIMGTQVADAGRVADGVATAADRAVTGYVRMLVGESCSRCVVLAGRWYRWNQGFRRHPLCFPPGVVVSGPRLRAATRRWYKGELIVLTTESGQDLALTGNHPILTRCGWLPANLLQEGHEVVRSTAPQGAVPLMVPHHHEVPSLIEDVWDSFRVGGLERVPSTPEDFHGDGQRGQVDVVHADSSLRNGLDATISQQLRKLGFPIRVVHTAELDIERVSELADLIDSAHAGDAIGGSGLRLALGLRHGGCTDLPGLAHVATLDAGLTEATGDHAASHAVLARERPFARPSFVGADDVLGRNDSALARWDAPGDPFSVETGERYAALGRDLLDRLTGQVELDRVVELRRVEWSGHVYSLTSSEGWHSANNLIVSNCDCTHVPTREATAGDLAIDPDAYFKSLSRAEQDRIFTKDGAQAIRDGADIGQVVNARRGMATAAGPRGRDVFVTREGVSRRGGVNRRRTGRNMTARLMPESIYSIAENRDDAIRLLRRHGYIA